ncbi:MAG: SIR2 family protein [Bacteroidales bacterium]|nr:SIR2 family protein [Bacteroidales bacterium]
METLNDICSLVRKEDVTLFVGSGCSIPVAPPASALSKKFYEELNDSMREGVDENNLQETSSRLMLQEGDSLKRDEIIKMSFSGLTPQAFHNNMALIPHIHTIITTNYDTLIEDAFCCGGIQVFRKDSECCCFQERQTHLYKIHGDVNELGSIVLSTEDYRRTIKSPSQPILWNHVLSEFTKHHVVFVGYSLSDGNILNLIEYVKDMFGSEAKGMYMVAPTISEVQKKKLSSLGIKPVISDAEKFSASVLQSLKDHYAEDLHCLNCSEETAAKFALLNNLSISLKRKVSEVNINGYSALKGSPNVQLHMTTKPIELFTKGFSVSDFTDVEFGSGPMVKIPSEDLQHLETRVNGLRFDWDEMKQDLYIGPVEKSVQMRLSVPSRGILEEWTMSSYGARDGVLMKWECPVLSLKVVIRINENGTGITGDFNMTVKDRYENNDLAIRIFTAICAYLECADAELSLNKGKLQKYTPTHDKIRIVKLWLEYASILKSIELAYGEKFKYYEPYDKDRMEAASIVLAYLRKEVRLVNSKRILSFDCTYSPDYDYPVGSTYAVVGKRTLEKGIEVGGICFPIFHETMMFNGRILENTRLDEKTMHFRMENKDGVERYVYSDVVDE